MDEETIKQYQKKYNFSDEDITWANTNIKIPVKNFPIINTTYFFVQTDGAIYIGTVSKRKGAYYYTIHVEENINNILENKKGDIIKILIKYTNPAEKMVMWAKIPNYDSVDNLLDELSTLNLNKEQKINEFLNKESQKEDDDSRIIPTNINLSRSSYAKKERTTNITTGRRFGGRKKTKRNKNKKRKTSKKR